MANMHLIHAPLLQNPAPLLVLPLNSAGIILDPILARCKTLYSDNYLNYRRACIDKSLTVGDCLLYQRQQTTLGLNASSNHNQPRHIANLIVTDHPYHPIRKLWLSQALEALHTQLYPLIRYEGLRHIAIFARPLLYTDYDNSIEATDGNTATPLTSATSAELSVPVLDWHDDIYPLIQDRLKDLPKLRISVHVPRDIEI
ncbi:hypothetical protein [Psychrobacter sp. I-STPA10]|uniref:hypothetical protein n=1 Tax=Psychrobacter sp. I-STPA10 TaxID=2585769 RepID=UPI001E321EAF|nr:hypothetical protein [Psychrobacter sp. I-STPA10]